MLTRLNKILFLNVSLISIFSLFYLNQHWFINTLYFPSTINTDPVIVKWERTDNISCHHRTNENYLRVINQDFHPGFNSIFFHETSCRGGLNSRQACNVEAAARIHPNRKVHVLFSSPVSKFTVENTCLTKLLQISNIFMARVNIEEYAKGTVLEDEIKQHIFEQSKYKIEHASDFLRFMTLQKYGGIYLDTDVMAVRSLDELGTDWVAQESSSLINNAVVAASFDGVGQEVVEAVLEEIKTTYRPDLWSHNGPEAVTRVLQKFCEDKLKKEEVGTSCQGYKIYPPQVIYPIYYTNSTQYFKPGKLEGAEEAYTHHFWNKVTQNYVIGKDSPYEAMAKTYCPTIYDMFGERFGV